jgi:hypothetical protein
VYNCYCDSIQARIVLAEDFGLTHLDLISNSDDEDEHYYLSIDESCMYLYVLKTSILPTSIDESCA